MIILVPVKRVIDPYTKVKPLGDGTAVDTTGVKFEINPFDEIACEEAVRIKEKQPDTKIVVVSIGSGECEDQLRKALAMGADEAILVETSKPMDSLGIAKELQAIAVQIGADLIIMGKQSTDGDCNQAGQMLAARLDWPQATFASKVEINGTSVTVSREGDQGEETLSMSLPCLITSDLRLNEPRYIALPGIIKARSKPLSRQPAAVNSAPKSRITNYAPAAARQAGVRVNSAAELVEALQTKGVLPR